MAESIPLLVVCGPTASGKTGLAVRLARCFGGEVVSADSMQIYRRMDIGTAKPTSSEMGEIPHHLLDIVEPSETFSLVEYLERAHLVIKDIHRRNRLPVVVGGTGLYISSLVDNIQFEELASNEALRESLRIQGEEHGPMYLWEKLRDCDPVLAERLHPNNRGRIIRALEVYTLTGSPMSELQRKSRLGQSPYKLCMLGLCYQDRRLLYHKINARVDAMLAGGLLDEVQLLRRETLSKTAAQAIGYKELFDYLDGVESLDDAVERIKLQTRRYAKRQLTWLRRDPRIRWFAWDLFESDGDLVQQATDTAMAELEIHSR